MTDQNSQFYAVLTHVGEAKQANANALGLAWKITHMGIGDANGAEVVPDPSRPALINEWRRAPLNQLSVDPNNDSIIIAEQVIPPNEGGYWIREIGLYDEDGDLVAVANCAPSFKPLLSQGSGRTQVVRMHLIVSSAASVQLKIDPSVVVATRNYVDQAIVVMATAIQTHANSQSAHTAAQIGYAQTTGIQREKTSEALDFLGRANKQGVFLTPPQLGHKAGQLAYRISAGGKVSLLTDLRKWYPVGALCTPETAASMGLKAYYVKPGGDNLAAGTSWATGLASVNAAISKADVDVVFVAAGTYLNGSHLHTYSGVRNVSVQAVGGPVFFISAPVPNIDSFLSTAAPNVWSRGVADAALVGVVALDYTDEYGLPYVLTQRTDVNGVIANNGSWWRSAGNELFVSMPDGAPPVAGRVLYFIATAMRVSAPGVKFHHKGICYVGGNAGAFSARGGNTNSVVISENVRCVGQHQYDAYQIKDIGLSIAIGCVASKSGNDGFNYHALNGISPHFIEVDCVGVQGKASGTGNGSTAHESVVGIRLGCDYAFNQGPGIADVNDARTFNVGVSSRSNGPHANASGFLASSEGAVGEGVMMWLHACSAGGNSAPDVTAAGAKVFVRDSYYSSKNESLGGTIADF